MRKKLGAWSKEMLTSRLLSHKICIESSTIFGVSNIRFSRDEILDIWYTTMLGYSLAVMDSALAQPSAAHRTQELLATSVASFFMVAVHHTMARLSLRSA